MKPRTAHLVILGVLGIPLFLAGGYFSWTGARSHSLTSGIAQALGVVLLAGAIGYSALTSVLVWKWGTSAKRVLVVHAGILGLGPLLAWLLTRIRFFFS